MTITLNQTNALYSYYKKKYMGPIGCMPATKASLRITCDCAHEPSVIAKMHNIALPILLKKIQIRGSYQDSNMHYTTTTPPWQKERFTALNLVMLIRHASFYSIKSHYIC